MQECIHSPWTAGCTFANQWLSSDSSGRGGCGQNYSGHWRIESQIAMTQTCRSLNSNVSKNPAANHLRGAQVPICQWSPLAGKSSSTWVSSHIKYPITSIFCIFLWPLCPHYIPIMYIPTMSLSSFCLHIPVYSFCIPKEESTFYRLRPETSLPFKRNRSFGATWVTALVDLVDLVGSMSSIRLFKAFHSYSNNAL